MRKSTILSRKEKNPLWKWLVLAELHTLASRFRTKKSLSNLNLSNIMLKTRFPFIYASTSLDTKNINNPHFESCLSIHCLVSQHFLVFPFLPLVFPLPLATLPIIAWSSSTLHWAVEIKKMCLQWVTFPKKSSSIIIDVMGVSLSHWFVVTGGKIISWHGTSCLWPFMS